MSESNINCPKCGASLKGDSLFCNYCGTAIADIRDILKKQEENKLEKERAAIEKSRIEAQMRRDAQQHRADKARYIGAAIFLFVAILPLILFFIYTMKD